MYNFTTKDKGKNYKFMDLRERKKIILTTGNTSVLAKVIPLLGHIKVSH